MPYESEKQARLMRAVAHGWKPSKIDGPTTAVAKKFVNDSDRQGRTKMAFGGALGMMRNPNMYRGTNSSPQADGRLAPQMSSGVSISPELMAREQRPQQRPQPTSIDRGPSGALAQAGPQLGRRGAPMPRGAQRVAQPQQRRGYPGGGNPMLGGRNPVARMANQRAQQSGARPQGPLSRFR